MNICVVGAGAIGGLLAAPLGLRGHRLTLIARGAHLQAIRQNGLTVLRQGERICMRDAHATDELDSVPPQDVVLLTLKSHQIAAVAAQLPRLLGANGVLVTMQNGMPWWYFHAIDGAHAGRVIESVDPGGVLMRTIDAQRILGCVAYPAASVEQPGVIRHSEGVRFPLGELNGEVSARAQGVADMLIDAGFKSPVVDDIRSEIWLKLLGNLAFNPISALCHATLETVCRYSPTRELAARMMREARAVGEALGATFRVDIANRIAGAEKVGAHKTSMLQDAEAGKPLELAAMLGAVIELGDVVGVQVDVLRAVHACAGLLNEVIVHDKVAVGARALTSAD